MIQGLNHITFTVSSLPVALAFYTELLVFRLEHRWQTGAYLSAANIWLALLEGEAKPAADYSHISFSIDARDFQAWHKKLCDWPVSFWQENKSEGDSLYFLDPDGHKLELHVGDINSRLGSV